MRRLLTGLTASSLLLSSMAGCTVVVPNTPDTAQPASQAAQPASQAAQPATPSQPTGTIIKRDESNPGQPTGTIKKKSPFAGNWNTTYGWMTLEVDGIAVTGTYEGKGRIEGTTDDAGKILKATWTDSTGTGRVTFTVSDDGTKISGQWSDSGDSSNKKAWTGTKQD